VNTGVSTGVNNNEVWCLRFLRAQVLNVRGQVEEAFSYLESFRPPDAADIESIARLKMQRASYSGFLGRYGTSHQLFNEAEGDSPRC
jgi:hypothetical protein